MIQKCIKNQRFPFEEQDFYFFVFDTNLSVLESVYKSNSGLFDAWFFPKNLDNWELEISSKRPPRSFAMKKSKFTEEQTAFAPHQADPQSAKE